MTSRIGDGDRSRGIHISQDEQKDFAEILHRKDRRDLQDDQDDDGSHLEERSAGQPKDAAPIDGRNIVERLTLQFDSAAAGAVEPSAQLIRDLRADLNDVVDQLRGAQKSMLDVMQARPEQGQIFVHCTMLDYSLGQLGLSVAALRPLVFDAFQGSAGMSRGEVLTEAQKLISMISQVLDMVQMAGNSGTDQTPAADAKSNASQALAQFLDLDLLLQTLQKALSIAPKTGGGRSGSGAIPQITSEVFRPQTSHSADGHPYG